MSWFRRKSKEQLTPCPQCSKLLTLDAVECDLCGADLGDVPQGRAVPAHDQGANNAARVR